MRGSRLRSLLVVGAAAAALAVTVGGVRAQEVRAPAAGEAAPARNAHVVVPQSRGFLLDRRGDVVVVEAVRAHVTLRGAAATTVLDVALRNPGSQRAEAVMLLPVPAGAAVGSFDFEGAGAEPTARLLPAAEARRLYDDVVRRARDPALLEFAGHDLVRSSVFPVEPGGTQRVRLSYDHVAPVDGPRVDYVLPRSEALDVRIPWDVTVDVAGTAPVATAYSPTHAVELERLSDRRLRVRVKTGARTEPGSFRLSVLRAQEGVGASLFAYPDPASDGGTFLFLAGVPSPPSGQRPAARQVTLALDRSGSMAGAKLDQARAAALQVIEGLADGERFNVVDYGTTLARFSAGPVVKSRETVLQARAYLEGLRPNGGTNLHDALVEALRQPVAEGALPIVLFLTDGLPTVGRRSEAAITAVVEDQGVDAPRVFTFGVGNDVNAPLLDRIADRTRAVATYVRPDDDVELAVDRVFRRLAGPILAAPRLEALPAWGGVEARRVHDTIPDRLPDVFDGDHVVVLGKYRGQGTLHLRLRGVQGGEDRSWDFSFDLAGATTAHAFVPRLWAARRIAYLTDEVRQAAADHPEQPPSRELTDEIVRLSTAFGILTEYTSFLATEGTDLGAWGELVAACSAELDRRAVNGRSGAIGVQQGMNFNDRKWQSVQNGSNRYVGDDLSEVSVRGVRQAADRSFFRRGRVWIDGALAGDAGGREPDRVIEYGSDEHLELLHSLVLENRQAVLSLRGDIVLRVGGRTVLISNPEDC